MRQILGVVTPDSGVINIDGMTISEMQRLERNYIGYMTQTAYPSFWLLKLRECISVMAQLRGVPQKEAFEEQCALFEYFGFPETHLNRIFYTLSGGQRRIVCFCMANMGNPRYLILDEPSNDLDPETRIRMWQYLNKVNQAGTTVVLVTHNLAEVEKSIKEFVVFKSWTDHFKANN